jgi:hypothetical protein
VALVLLTQIGRFSASKNVAAEPVAWSCSISYLSADPRSLPAATRAIAAKICEDYGEDNRQVMRQWGSNAGRAYLRDITTDQLPLSGTQDHLLLDP